MSIINNVLRKKNKNKKPTALCFFYDGRFDSELANLDITLIGPQELSIYPWTFNNNHPNIKFIDKNSIEQYEYDFIVFNHIAAHNDLINSLPRKLHLPGVIFSHEPNPETPYHLKQRILTSRLDYVEVDSMYGISDNSLAKEKDIDILMTGNFDPTLTAIVNRLRSENINIVTIGNNPTLKCNAYPNGYEDYKSYFARSKVFLSLPGHRGIPYDILLAIASNTEVIFQKNDRILNKIPVSPYLACDSFNDMIVKAKATVNRVRPNELKTNRETLLNQYQYDKFNTKFSNIINTYTKRIYHV